MIAEMIHSASLIHDDVIDQSDFRRGKPSVNALWSHKKVCNTLQNTRYRDYNLIILLVFKLILSLLFHKHFINIIVDIICHHI